MLGAKLGRGHPARDRENLNTPNHITLANEREKSPEIQFEYQTHVAIHRRKNPAMTVFSQSAIPIIE